MNLCLLLLFPLLSSAEMSSDFVDGSVATLCIDLLDDTHSSSFSSFVSTLCIPDNSISFSSGEVTFSLSPTSMPVTASHSLSPNNSASFSFDEITPTLSSTIMSFSDNYSFSKPLTPTNVSPTTSGIGITNIVLIGGPIVALVVLTLIVICCCLCVIWRRQSRKKKSYNLKVQELLREETYLKKPSLRVSLAALEEPYIGLEISTFTVKNKIPTSLEENNECNKESNSEEENSSELKEEIEDNSGAAKNANGITIKDTTSDAQSHFASMDKTMHQILQTLADS